MFVYELSDAPRQHALPLFDVRDAPRHADAMRHEYAGCR